MSEFLMREQREEKKATENPTNIPTQLKKQVEQASGVSLDDVRVHYHSDRPRRLGALAYAQGNQIYVMSGEERHLPHELGHVVQQKKGMVKPARFVNGYALNDDPVLEQQADQIGRL